ncbi:MAG: MGMT family protein [Patescibacteria group bacterium]
MMLSFNEKVYRAAKKIPRGKVATYQWIARKINNPGSVRAVGNALHKNPYAPHVPCHRVVCSDGRLGGFAGGAGKKEKLLRREGVSIKNKRIDLLKFGLG